jgi:hypothetical protein
MSRCHCLGSDSNPINSRKLVIADHSASKSQRGSQSLREVLENALIETCLLKRGQKDHSMVSKHSTSRNKDLIVILLMVMKTKKEPGIISADRKEA